MRIHLRVKHGLATFHFSTNTFHERELVNLISVDEESNREEGDENTGRVCE